MNGLHILAIVFLTGVIGVGIPAFLQEIGYFDYIKEKKKENKK